MIRTEKKWGKAGEGILASDPGPWFTLQPVTMESILIFTFFNLYLL